MPLAAGLDGVGIERFANQDQARPLDGPWPEVGLGQIQLGEGIRSKEIIVQSKRSRSEA
jgi:hypothetical protein